MASTAHAISTASLIFGDVKSRGSGMQSNSRTASQKAVRVELEIADHNRVVASDCD